MNSLKNEQQGTSETFFGLTDKQVEEIKNKAVEKVLRARHEWRQKGQWIICQSCETPHAFCVGMNKRLIGIGEQGEPLIKELKNGIHHS